MSAGNRERTRCPPPCRTDNRRIPVRTLSACTEMLAPPKAGPGTAGILPARFRAARCRQKSANGQDAHRSLPNSGTDTERLYRNAYPAEGGAWDRGHPARTFPRGAMSAGKRKWTRCPPIPAVPDNRRIPARTLSAGRAAAPRKKQPRRRPPLDCAPPACYMRVVSVRVVASQPGPGRLRRLRYAQVCRATRS